MIYHVPGFGYVYEKYGEAFLIDPKGRLRSLPIGPEMLKDMRRAYQRTLGNPHLTNLFEYPGPDARILTGNRETLVSAGSTVEMCNIDIGASEALILKNAGVFNSRAKEVVNNSLGYDIKLNIIINGDPLDVDHIGFDMYSGKAEIRQIYPGEANLKINITNTCIANFHCITYWAAWAVPKERTE